MRVKSIYNCRINDVFIIGEVCFVDADLDVLCADLFAAEFGEGEVIDGNGSLDVRGEYAIDVPCDGNVG